MKAGRLRRAHAPTLVAALYAATTSCAVFSDPDVTEVISGVRSFSGVQADFFDQDAPDAAGGPDAQAALLGAVIPGGSAPVQLTTSATASEVAVFIEGRSGYFLLTLGSATDTVSLVLTLSQDLPDTAVTVSFSLAAGGPFGAATTSVLRPTPVGTGQVQVSLTWDVASDVDLHVVDPNGEEIYYGNRTSPSSGELDLDSNAACSIDGVNQENITWSTAPRGEYIVRVDYWDSCGLAASNYVVTVQIEGRAPQVFSGTLTGLGSQGGLGSGTEITRFTF